MRTHCNCTVYIGITRTNAHVNYRIIARHAWYRCAIGKLLIQMLHLVDRVVVVYFMLFFFPSLMYTSNVVSLGGIVKKKSKGELSKVFADIFGTFLIDSLLWSKRIKSFPLKYI